MKIKIRKSAWFKSFVFATLVLFLGCSENTLEPNQYLKDGDIIELTFEGPVSYSYQLEGGENKTYQASDGEIISLKTTQKTNPATFGGLAFFSFNPGGTPKLGMGADPTWEHPTTHVKYDDATYKDPFKFTNETKGETLDNDTFINFTGKFLKAKSVRQAGGSKEYTPDQLIAHAEDSAKDNTIWAEKAPITFKILGATAPAADDGQITTGGDEEAGKAGCMLYQGNAPTNPWGLAFMGLGLGILFSASLRISFVLLRSALR